MAVHLHLNILISVHYIVYTNFMKNITLSAQEDLIEKARHVALQKNSTLNEMFRTWLKSLSAESQLVDGTQKLTHLWEKTSYLQMGKKLSREEMNER